MYIRLYYTKITKITSINYLSRIQYNNISIFKTYRQVFA